MSYEDWRTRSIHNMSNAVVREFVNCYRCRRPTVVLLPGGMGSQLDRSLDSYIDGRTPLIDYDPVWIDLGTIFDGQARSLLIEDSGRDRDSHVIIADGALRFFVNAYDATEQFFRDENVNANYIVFGYDWRRPLAEAAAFLERFLKQLQARVFAKHREDPLPNLTLLAHSQGGLVAKIFLHNVVDISAWMKQLITVGTPFYGTWSQQRRYFVGESMLRAIYPASEMVSIISSLPGPYGLMFPPRSIFDTYGAQLGLKRYPMRTASDGDGADPYAVPSLSLYPKWINIQHLYDAGQVYRTIAAPLPENVAQRVYNIRSIAEDTPWNSRGMSCRPTLIRTLMTALSGAALRAKAMAPCRSGRRFMSLFRPPTGRN